MAFVTISDPTSLLDSFKGDVLYCEGKRYRVSRFRGCNSVGRVLAFQASCRAFEPRHPLHFNTLYGDRSLVVKAPDCGSGYRGFESHRSPQFLKDEKHLESRFEAFNPENVLLNKIEKSQVNKPGSTLSSTKLQHVGAGFLSVAQAAHALGISTISVTRWCESGKLPAIAKPYGRKVTYQISPQAIEFVLRQQKAYTPAASKPKQVAKPHSEYVNSWVKAMSKGLISGKAFSKRTIDDYLHYINLYFLRHSCISFNALKVELMRINPQSFSKRHHYYHAVVCLTKFLVHEQVLEEETLTQLKSLKPKRHLPPKRRTISEGELKDIAANCNSPINKALLILLSETGLRASECCNLLWSDVDLQSGILTVRLGKGNKTRRIGLSPNACEALKVYQFSLKAVKQFVFINKNGKPIDRHSLYKRMDRLGEKVGVEVSPHALRRAFVTINANKGRPLQMIQKACGHSSITTTMGYCLTAEHEVIEAMKQWT